MGTRVHGRDAAAEAYRVSVGAGANRLDALVPERLMHSGWRPGARPSHQDAYEWIARNARKIEDAMTTLAAGHSPRPPFDEVLLVKEA